MTSTTTELPLKPNIRNYSNPLKFLNDYYVFRKKNDDHFSYEIWAAELGFKSRIFMYLLCNGKRPVTAQFVDRLATYLKFSEAEKNHFLLLSSYSKAKAPEIKAIFYDKILESIQNKENILQAKDYFQFVSSPTMPLIKMILAFDDIKGNVSEISQLLNIDNKKINKDLLALEKMGFITKTYKETSEEVFWKSTDKAFRVPDDRSNYIMEQFNQMTLSEASDVNKQSDIFKKFRSIIFAIKNENHLDMLNEMENFLSKMKNKYGCDDINDKHLMKINLQAYPVSKTASLK